MLTQLGEKNNASTIEEKDEEEPQNRDASDDNDIIFVIPATDTTAAPNRINVNSISDPSKRQLVESVIANTQQHIAAQIVLISGSPDTPHKGGLAQAVMTSAFGRVQPVIDGDPNKSKYIGIFLDVKTTGEPNHRPNIRQPPLRPEPYKRLIEMARSRGRGDETETDDGIDETDMFFLMDGGKSGHQTELLRPFHSKKKVVKQYILIKDENSQLNRMQRARGGINTVRLHETMYVVSKQVPSMKSRPFVDYKFSSGGSVIGPIVMPPLSELWEATWQTKKEIYMVENLIAVGGKADEDDDMDEPTVKAKPRTPNVIEPVFYHNLPETFYSEILAAFPLAGVLDLTPGDGSFALAAFKANIVYCGICFGDVHKAQLQKHIERKIWQAMSNDASPIYEPRLVAALVGDAGDTPRPSKAKPKTAARKPAPKATPTKGVKRGRDAGDDDPEGKDDEGDDDPDILSGDDDPAK